MKKSEIVRIEITGKTILFTVGVLLFLMVIRNLTDLFLNLFIAFILMSSLKPSVDWLELKKIPRSLASVLVIISSLTFILFSFILFCPR